MYGKIAKVQGQLRAGTSVWDREDLDVLIVRAAYGLLHPHEAICNYDLQMKERLGADRVYKRWGMLGAVFGRYVVVRGVTPVWSLLPDSAGLPYHRVFDTFWEEAARQGDCDARRLCPLDKHGANERSTVGISRGMWLATVASQRPESLAAAELPLNALERVGG